MNSLPRSFLCLALALSVLSLARAAEPATTEFPDISIAELKQAIAEKKVTLIDTNGHASFARGHLPTALNYFAINKDLATKLPADKNTLIVAYCGGPKCEAYKKPAQAIKDLGYTNVKHLSAGISGWLEANEATEK